MFVYICGCILLDKYIQKMEYFDKEFWDYICEFLIKLHQDKNFGKDENFKGSYV